MSVGGSLVCRGCRPDAGRPEPVALSPGLRPEKYGLIAANVSPLRNLRWPEIFTSSPA